jgi:NADH-quinone oxidoreductase subunit G
VLQGRSELSDTRVLSLLADAMGAPIGLPTPEDAARELAELADLEPWTGAAPAAPTVDPRQVAQPGAGEAVLATWHMLLDDGRMQDGEPYLAGTARRPVVRLSAATAAEVGAVDGDPVTVSTARGAVTLPLRVTDMPDRVAWLPTRSGPSAVRRWLVADAGDVVRLSAGGGAA